MLNNIRFSNQRHMLKSSSLVVRTLFTTTLILSLHLILSATGSDILIGKAQADNQLAKNQNAKERCGYSAIHKLKYNSSDKHFDYVNPSAPKGGTIRVNRLGSYDSLNFLRYPGTTLVTRGQIPKDTAAFLFDSLLVVSSDEPSAYYCLAATSIDVTKDLSSVSFTLTKSAKWHDGKPVTIDDLMFTFKTLKSQGPPYYRQVLRKITVSKTAHDTITYTSGRKGDRSFVSLVGTLPIHPKHFWEKNGLKQKSMTIPLGSGPYRIVKATAGKTAHLSRVKNYWAKDHFTQKGRYNFDEVVFNYYRDNRTALESFKTGNDDIRLEDDAVAWSKEYKGPSLDKGEIIKTSFPSNDPGKMIMLTFNQRNPVFKDRRVRKALALLYDFEAANRILFHGLYTPVKSAYGTSELAASRKATAEQQALLKPFLNKLPENILNQPGPDLENNKLTSRQRIRAASKLLDEAGLKLSGNSRIDPNTGKPLVFSILYMNRRHQRILLHYAESLKAVGIELSIPELEAFAARKKMLEHDFDMTILQWMPKMLVGTSEHLLWGSQLADVKGSYALAGLKDPAIDASITAMQRAPDWQAMKSAAKTFDRIFRWQIHAIPLWHSNEEWISTSKSIETPEPSPLFETTYVDRFWQKPLKQSSLK